MKRQLAALLLTIFALSLTACGETAAELLFEQILDAKHAQIREEVINSELIVRESSDRSFMQ